ATRRDVPHPVALARRLAAHRRRLLSHRGRRDRRHAGSGRRRARLGRLRASGQRLARRGATGLCRAESGPLRPRYDVSRRRVTPPFVSRRGAPALIVRSWLWVLLGAAAMLLVL